MLPKKQNLIFGAVVCTIGYFFIAAMGACSKLVTDHIPVAAVLFFQNVICFVFTIPRVAKEGFSHLKTKRIGLHLIRDFTGIASFFTLFISLKSIALVDAMLLQNTAPLWIPLVILIWLRIRINPKLWWGMVLGFIGIIFILKPGESALHLGLIWGLVSGMLLGVSSFD